MSDWQILVLILVVGVCLRFTLLATCKQRKAKMADGNNYPGFKMLSEASKEDMSNIKWEEKVVHHAKNTLKNFRRVEYEVAGIGTVGEEWRIMLVSLDGKTVDEKAFHSVFVNGHLVRKVDMQTGLKIVADRAFEPFDFLRYDAYGSTEKMAKGDQVPVVGKEESKTGGPPKN